ncbi:MAG: FeoA family protein [Desulfomonilaceae bacterium]
MKDLQTSQQAKIGCADSSREAHVEGRRLANCAHGEMCRVHKIAGDSECRLRLLEIGFTRGTRIRVVKDAPLKDPLEIRVKGFNVALRKALARDILVDQDLEEE